MAGTRKTKKPDSYEHTGSTTPMRPEAGVQAQFMKRRPPRNYRFDSSLDPEMRWDSAPARELGEWLLSCIDEAAKLPAPHIFDEPRTYWLTEDAAQGKRRAGEKQPGNPDGAVPFMTVTGLADAVQQLKQLSDPFLNWSGKAEQPQMEVPSLPLFIHERLSTEAIIETLKLHRRENGQPKMANLFGDPEHSVTDQLLRAYEYQDEWVNRLILGDSLQMMNSLLEFESMAGKVQMIFMDPPYGVKFGSNFQPFIRKRDVVHNSDADLSREPEMVKAYRDTWELGLHSYLTYLRERLDLCRELLTQEGSIFVQISDENVHHVREVMTEIFGAENFVNTIVFQKTSSEESDEVANVADYLLWFAKDIRNLSVTKLYIGKKPGQRGAKQYTQLRSPDGKSFRKMTPEELADTRRIPTGWKVCRKGFPLTSQGASKSRSGSFTFEGKQYFPGSNRHWSVDPETAMHRLVELDHIYSTGNSICAVMHLEDMPVTELDSIWLDTGTGSFTEEQIYTVQTPQKVIERCMLLTTKPGDLVLDPTCGSGTTAVAAEKWGRRWITADTSRVPLTLARQRLLSAVFPYYRLKSPKAGPAAGFIYADKKDSKNLRADGHGVEYQHTLGTLSGEASGATQILLSDHPEIDYEIARVTGAFCIEAVIPPPMELSAAGITEDHLLPATGRFGRDDVVGLGDVQEYSRYIARMISVLRASPIIRLHGGGELKLAQVRPSSGLQLHAEAVLESKPEHTVGVVFGPEDSMVTESLVFNAGREAYERGHRTMLVFGFAFDVRAREFLDASGTQIRGVESHAVEMTPDLAMYDLLKNTRASQLFSIAGQPEVELLRHAREGAEGLDLYRVRVLGLDTVNPETMELSGLEGKNLPAWFLDSDYNGRVFRVCQAYFPRTRAWDNLQKALKADFNEAVWERLAGTVSEPFPAGEHGRIGVKVIDDRGNELIAVKPLSEAIHPGETGASEPQLEDQPT